MSKNMDKYLMGKKIIIAGINIDEGLAELLKFQIKSLKRLVKDNSPIDEIQKANSLLRNIIIALSISDEKIKLGIALCEEDEE